MSFFFWGGMVSKSLTKSTMSNEPIKNWTVLIYANGNNELEPETQQAMADLEKMATSEDMNVVVQLGRAKYGLVRILRPGIARDEHYWSGVRRYCLSPGKSILLQNLGEENMADPKRLYEFLKWGIKRYPAKRYILILSGHGFQFVGVMTDYSQKAPYIMGIPEMVRAINMAANDTGSQIDLLILDVCYFNFIESIYELGKEKNHAVQNVITYIYNGPLRGLPYDQLLTTLNRQPCSAAMREIVKHLVDALPFDLIAFEINHGKLETIKGLFNELALQYWHSNPLKEDANLVHLLHTHNPTANWYSLSRRTLTGLLSTVICARKMSEDNKLPVNYANITTSDTALISRYYRLGFAQNNNWTYLLSNKTFDVNAPVQSRQELRPLKLTPQEVYTYISVMSPGMAQDRKEKTVGDLFRYNKWKT